MVSITKAGEPSSSRLAPSHGGSQQGTPSKPSKKGKEKAVNVDSEIVNGSAASHAGMTAWEWTDIAERSDGGQRPVFSNDGRYYMIASGSQILIHETNAPDYALVSTLPAQSTSTAGHQAPIIAYHLHPVNPLELITADRDGHVKVWSWTDGTLIRSLDVGAAVKERWGAVSNVRRMERMIIGVDGGMVAAYVVVEVDYAEHQGSLRYVLRMPIRTRNKRDPTTGKSIPVPLAKDLFRLGSTGMPITSISISPRNTYIALTTPDSILIRKLNNNKNTETHWLKIVPESEVTCLEWSPDENGGTVSLVRKSEEEWFATGERGGVIRLYRSGLANAFESLNETSPSLLPKSKTLREAIEITLPSTPFHWHSNPVRALCFTTFGAQLLSGSDENVLVNWHLDNGNKSFIARLSVGARPFEWIGVKPIGTAGQRDGREEEYWSGFTDGSIVKVGAATKKAVGVGKAIRLQTLEGFKSFDRKLPLAYHGPSESVVLNSSHPSTLQFYQPSTNSLLFDLEVIPSNRVARKGIQPIQVESVVFSPASGRDEAAQWMATYESRNASDESDDEDESEGSGRVRAIKIWHWTKAGYVLNTHLDRAHGTANITGMSFAPATGGLGMDKKSSGWFLLTTADDGGAKLWALKRGVTEDKENRKKGQRQEEAFWALRSSFNYRQLPIHSSLLSNDGTLLVLAHGSVISLWSTSSNTLLRTLSTADVPDIRNVTFVGKGGRWLVGSGAWKLKAGSKKTGGVATGSDDEQQQTKFSKPTGGIAMWDLLRCEPLWTKESLPISQILPHPTTEEFTILRPASQKSTVIETYTATSPRPVRSNTLPLRLVKSIYLPRASLRGDAQEQERAYEFVGIRLNGSVIRFGQKVLPPQRALRSSGNAGNLLGAQSGRVMNKSVWEEMFGTAAFGNPSNQDKENTVVSASQALFDEGKKTGAPVYNEKRGRYSSVFDGPASTLPPTSLLFDAFIKDFMSLNTTTNINSNATSSSSSTKPPAAGQTLSKDKILFEPALPGAGKAAKKREERVWEGRMVEEEEVRGWFVQMRNKEKVKATKVNPPQATPQTKSLLPLDASVSTPSKPAPQQTPSQTPLPTSQSQPKLNSSTKKGKKIAGGGGGGANGDGHGDVDVSMEVEVGVGTPTGSGKKGRGGKKRKAGD